MKHTILVVEDERELREMMQDALERDGYAVVAASDGKEALDRLEGIEQLCLVLLDLVMPRMNGWDFYAQLRLRAAYTTVPVVVHTSSLSNPPIGVTRVLRKPVELEKLMSAVKECCCADGAV